MSKKWRLTLLFFYFLQIYCANIEAAFSFSPVNLYKLAKCKLFECCGKPWINRNLTDDLERDIGERLYGQHIAHEQVISALISKNLIDHFVPFLPLERKHVFMCAKHYLKLNNITCEYHQLLELADSLKYFPKGATTLFSKSGCKEVEKKADRLLKPKTYAGDEHNEF